MKIEKEVVFKPNHKPIILILIFCFIGIIILKQFAKLDDGFIYGLGSMLIILTLIYFYKQTQYDFEIKINQHLLSYKNDKKVFDLKRIESFYTVIQTNRTPAKLVISYNGKEEVLLLENFKKSKLERVSQVLNERIKEVRV